MIFDDRYDAGRRLALRLSDYAGPDTIVLAVPRGGVETGYEVAMALNAPLDVIIPRKIPAPGQPEYAIGAVAGEDICVLNEETVGYLGVKDNSYLQEEIRRQRDEIVRRTRLYRGDKPFPSIEGRTVILVDDGVATGYTIIAAAREIMAKHPKRLILAVPVAPPDAVNRLNHEVDELVILEIPEVFYAVGEWYVQFVQTSDEQVIELLRRAGAR